MRLSSIVVGDSNDEINFPHKSFITNVQALRHRKAFANNSSANIKLSKSRMHKIGQTEGFLFGPNIFGSQIKEIRSSANSIKNLFGKELMNKDPKEIDSKLFLDTELH